MIPVAILLLCDVPAFPCGSPAAAAVSEMNNKNVVNKLINGTDNPQYSKECNEKILLSSHFLISESHWKEMVCTTNIQDGKSINQYFFPQFKINYLGLREGGRQREDLGAESQLAQKRLLSPDKKLVVNL